MLPRFLAIIYVKYLHKSYKTITQKNIRGNQSSRVIATLILLQAKIAYYRAEFSCYGYYHPGGVYSKKHFLFREALFPIPDFEEMEIVVWHKYDAVKIYRNEIYRLDNGKQLTSTRIKYELFKMEKIDKPAYLHFASNIF